MNKKRDKLGRFVSNENTFIISNDILYCYLGDELLFFTDANLYNLITSLSWCKCANGYSATHISGKEILLHRFLINPNSGELVDHKNGNKKDNTLSNLRICNKSQNAYNSKVRSNNKSGYTGVYFRNDTKKWVAEIKYLGKKISLGCFNTIEEAVEARKLAEIKYAKEYRRY